jgi:hypothetical protein
MKSLAARATVLAMALALLVTVRALGAMNASVAPASGPPGQTVTLQTIGVTGAYDALISSGSTSIFLVDPGITVAAVCDSVRVHEVGSLTWTGGVGRLTFSIPALPAGSYSFRALVPASGCWIIGGDTAPLALRIAVASPSSSDSWLLAIAVVIAAGLGLLVMRSRRSG